MGKTLKEIAELAGTSIATVSKVVNKKTHDIGEKTVLRVQEILDREGYQPNQIARTMKTRETKTIGLLIPDIRNPFFTEIARGAEDEASAAGYTVFLCNTDDNFKKEIRYLSELSSRQIDGIILAGAYERYLEEEQKFHLRAPLIAIDRKVSYPNKVAFITTDNFKSSHLLTETLIKQGHRRFLYVGGPQASDVTQLRYEGFKAALKEGQIKAHRVEFGNYSVDSGFEIILKTQYLKEITAIICGNDLIALGVLNALKELKVAVPHDISVTGFDNIDLAKSISPSLTTVNQPTYEMGRKAVEILLRNLAQKPIKPVYTLVQEIVLRDSSKKIQDES